MPLLRRPLPSLLLIALLGSVSVAALASPQQGKRKHDRGDQQGQQQPSTRKGHGRNGDAMSDSIRRVEQATGGQVLSAERVPYEGRSVNRIKVVDDRGRVRVYTDDPRQSRARQSRAAQPEAGQSSDGRSQGRHRPTRDDDD